MNFLAVARLLGFRTKAQTLSAVSSGRGWYNIIRESYPGAFQQNVTVDSPKDILSYSGVFSPLTLIASDIAKLRIKLNMEDAQGILTEVKSSSPFLPVLRKPNQYQNRIKFIEQWIIAKLLYGNAYILKVRDGRGIVKEMYVLDSTRVTVLVTDGGDVYYQLSTDHLSKLKEPITVPASEIIHDMTVALWHPLVGVSPIYASALSATQGRKIQVNSSKFFENMSRPSGSLTAPGLISDETANRLKSDWETNFSGANIGRLAVLGDGLKYEAMTIPAEQSQLTQQLEWTVRDIAACFHMPLFKVGGPVPAGHTIEALNLQYYCDCLQSLIEQLELCLGEGLSLPVEYSVEFDTDGLARMDTAAQISVLNTAVGGGWLAPNEARQKRNMKAVKGGESPMIQQQNYSLAALAKRDAKDDPFATSGGAAPPAAAPSAPGAPASPDDATQAEPDAKPAETGPTAEEKSLIEASRLIATLTKGLENV